MGSHLPCWGRGLTDPDPDPDPDHDHDHNPDPEVALLQIFGRRGLLH